MLIMDPLTMNGGGPNRPTPINQPSLVNQSFQAMGGHHLLHPNNSTFAPVQSVAFPPGQYPLGMPTSYGYPPQRPGQNGQIIFNLSSSGSPSASTPSNNPPSSSSSCSSSAPSHPNNSINRSQRCGVCRGCQCKPCGLCTYCQDSPQFGGPGVKKQSCIERRCLRVLENRLQRDAPTFKARVGCANCDDCRAPDCQICLVCLDKRFFNNRYMCGALCAKKRCNNATNLELPSSLQPTLNGNNSSNGNAERNHQQQQILKRSYDNANFEQMIAKRRGMEMMQQKQQQVLSIPTAEAIVLPVKVPAHSNISNLSAGSQQNSNQTRVASTPPSPSSQSSNNPSSRPSPPQQQSVAQSHAPANSMLTGNQISPTEKYGLRLPIYNGTIPQQQTCGFTKTESSIPLNGGEEITAAAPCSQPPVVCTSSAPTGATPSATTLNTIDSDGGPIIQTMAQTTGTPLILPIINTNNISSFATPSQLQQEQHPFYPTINPFEVPAIVMHQPLPSLSIQSNNHNYLQQQQFYSYHQYQNQRFLNYPKYEYYYEEEYRPPGAYSYTHYDAPDPFVPPSYSELKNGVVLQPL